MNHIAEQFRGEFPEHAASKLRIRAVPLHYDVVKHARPALFDPARRRRDGAADRLRQRGQPAAGAGHDPPGGVRAPHRAGREPGRAGAPGADREPAARARRAACWDSASPWGRWPCCAGCTRRTCRAWPTSSWTPPCWRSRSAICALTSVLFGLVPALRAANTDPQEHLKAGGRGGSAGDRRRRPEPAHHGGSGAVGGAAGGSRTSDPELPRAPAGGSRATTRATCSPSSCPCRSGSIPAAARAGPSSAISPGGSRPCPGSPRSGIVSQLPLTGSGPLSPFAYNEETARNFESVTADGRQISPEYFEAMDAQLLAGRTFSSTGLGGHAAGHHRGRDASRSWRGRARTPSASSSSSDRRARRTTFAEVVGVVEHMRQHDLTRDILHQIYYPIGQGTPTVMTFVVESGTRPGEPGADGAADGRRDGPRPAGEQADADEHAT